MLHLGQLVQLPEVYLSKGSCSVFYQDRIRSDRYFLLEGAGLLCQRPTLSIFNRLAKLSPVKVVSSDCWRCPAPDFQAFCLVSLTFRYIVVTNRGSVFLNKVSPLRGWGETRVRGEKMQGFLPGESNHLGSL